MSELVLMVAKFGFPTSVAAVLIYMLLRGEVQFRYPRLPNPQSKALPPDLGKTET